MERVSHLQEEQEDPYWHFVEEHEVNAIRVVKTGIAIERTRHGVWLRWLLIMVIVSCILGASMWDYQPDHPLVCDSAMDLEGKLHLWKYLPEYHCGVPTDKSAHPQPVTVQLHRQNIVK